MGIWFTGTVCSAIVAAEDFYTIDRLLAASTNPTFLKMVEHIGSTEVRELMRYLSSELNRLFFQWWNVAQLGLLTFALLAVGPLIRSRRVTWTLATMVGVVAFLMIALMPPIVTIGRSLDFVPRDPPPPGLRTFGLLHAAFSVITFINLILGALVTVWTIKDLEDANE